MRIRTLAIAVVALAVSGSAGAAPVQLVEAGGAQFPFRSYVLTLPNPQPLPLSRLHVTEQGAPVHALSVLPAGTAKQGQFGVVLVIDASESMRGAPIRDAMAAARAFAAHRNPSQLLAVVTFNNAVHVVQPLTTSSGAIRAALSRTPKLHYGTHMYDALQSSASLLTNGHVQGASIVLLSDGADVGSAARPADVLGALRGGHARAFTVGLASSAFDPSSLEQVASASHASYTRAAKPSDLTPIFDALGYRLSREYLVSYQSLAGPNVRVRVRARVDGVQGVASSGYLTPKLAIAEAASPYHPSLVTRIIESSVTMVIVALLAAGVFGWAIANAARPGSGSVVQRVASFVSVRREAGEEKEDPLAQRRVDLLRGAEGAFERLRWWPRFKATLELADVNASPTQIVLLTLLGTGIAMFILYLLIGGWGIVLSLGAPLVARMAVQSRLNRKRRAFADQLPDNLEVLAAALRAGHSLVAAISAVVESAPEPSTSEFRRIVAEEQLGVPLEDAVKTVVVRMENGDLDQVSLVARLQRETGANAAEVIDRVIETVRSRADLRRLVRTLTTQGRLSRWVLTGLPIGLALFLPLISHGYLDPLLHRGAGQVLLVFATVMVIAGSVVIGKIVDIKV
jgi:tight adherence protein B